MSANIFTLRPIYPAEEAMGTRWIGGLLDPRAVQDSVVKKKCSNRNSNHERRAVPHEVS
jgi:hypothetical protein